MHETERRRSILATVDASRFTAFEELGRQEEGSAATIRQIAAEDGLHRQVMRYAPPLAKTSRKPSQVGQRKSGEGLGNGVVNR